MKTLRKACSDSKGLLQQEVIALKQVNSPSESAIDWTMHVDFKKIYSYYTCNDFVSTGKHYS